MIGLERRIARAEARLGKARARVTDRTSWDWYAESCPCGQPPGECPSHPRARMSQRPPQGDWRVWGYVAGRGAGKTRAGAGWVQRRVEAGLMKLGCLIAPTANDIRDVMVEGPSGLLAVAPPWCRPVFEPSKRRVSWPGGARAICLSGEEPERARGLNVDTLWADELACLVAGTLVQTTEGLKPIESVRVGEMVWTRIGPCRVLDAWQSSPAAEIYRVRFSDGRTLEGTANHLVFIDKKGWIRIDLLQRGDRIVVWDNRHLTACLGEGSVGTSMAGTTCPARGDCCIAPFTVLTTEKSPRDTTFTTRMRIRRTGRRRTSRRFLARNISNDTGPEARLHGPGSSVRRSLGSSGRESNRATSFVSSAVLSSRAPGCERSSVIPDAGDGITTAPAESNRSRRSPRCQGRTNGGDAINHVRSVAPRSVRMIRERLRARENVGLPIACAGSPSVVGIEKLPNRVPVYDLTVQDAHEFYANGILVHNCWQRAQPTWDLAMLALRAGVNPQALITTTPRRVAVLRRILGEATTVRTSDTTYANKAHLPPQFLEQIVSLYENTRLGRQEIYAEFLETTEGVWFANFDPARHVTAEAEYHPGFPVRCAIDAGTSRHTAAVFFQVRPAPAAGWSRVTVFGDYLALDVVSAQNARAIKALADELPCRGHLDLVRLDPAATARSSLGPAAYGEYERVFGSRILARWPQHLVLDGLDTIELLLDTGNLTIHPRCTKLKDAFRNYCKQRRGGQWIDFPADGHPEEDLIDALRGGIRDAMPEGGAPLLDLPRIHASKLIG